MIRKLKKFFTYLFLSKANKILFRVYYPLRNDFYTKTISNVIGNTSLHLSDKYRTEILVIIEISVERMVKKIFDLLDDQTISVD